MQTSWDKWILLLLCLTVFKSTAHLPKTKHYHARLQWYTEKKKQTGRVKLDSETEDGVKVTFGVLLLGFYLKNGMKEWWKNTTAAKKKNQIILLPL